MTSNKDIKQFEKILQTASVYLNEKFAGYTVEELKALGGTSFEPHVLSALQDMAVGSQFENTISLVSGQKFPDIIAKLNQEKWLGVEVKTSLNSWTCQGGSIFEGTKIKEVAEIYVIFGNISSSLSVRWAQYQNCIEDIKVTHKPRFYLNLDLEKSPVFEKMQISYTDFSELNDKLKADYFRAYKKKTLCENADLWWLDGNDDADLLTKVRIFRDLSIRERNTIIAECYVLFPEVLTSNYNRAVRYVLGQKGVILSNVRDQFSGGGRNEKFSFKGDKYNVSNVIIKLSKRLELSKKFLNQVDKAELESYWGIKIGEPCDRVNLWIEQLVESINDDFLSKDGTNPLPFAEWLKSI